MNTENIKKLVSFLEDLDSSRFNMGYWVSDTEMGDTGNYLDTNACNTAGCIAGWALVLKSNSAIEIFDEYDIEEDMVLKDNQYHVEEIIDIAGEWLGLTCKQAMQLFTFHNDSLWYKYGHEYGLDYEYLRYYPNATSDIHPKHAADMLNRILNNEVEF